MIKGVGVTVLVLVVGLMSAAAGIFSARSSMSIRITDDNGGLVDDYIRFYERLRLSRVQVRIEGACISACTIVLSLPKSQVCITPEARLGFHLAHNVATNAPMPEATDDMIREYYPSIVQRWIKEHGPLKSSVTYMTGEEAISLGVLPPCP